MQCRARYFRAATQLHSCHGLRVRYRGVVGGCSKAETEGALTVTSSTMLSCGIGCWSQCIMVIFCSSRLVSLLPAPSWDPGHSLFEPSILTGSCAILYVRQGHILPERDLIRNPHAAVRNLQVQPSRLSPLKLGPICLY